MVRPNSWFFARAWNFLSTWTAATITATTATATTTATERFQSHSLSTCFEEVFDGAISLAQKSCWQLACTGGASWKNQHDMNHPTLIRSSAWKTTFRSPRSATKQWLILVENRLTFLGMDEVFKLFRFQNCKKASSKRFQKGLLLTHVVSRSGPCGAP